MVICSCKWCIESCIVNSILISNKLLLLKQRAHPTKTTYLLVVYKKCVEIINQVIS